MSNSGDDSQVWEMPGAGGGSGAGLAGMDAGGDGGSGCPCLPQPWRERPPAHDSQHRWDAEMYCLAFGFCDVLLSRAAVNRLKRTILSHEKMQKSGYNTEGVTSVSQKLTFFTWFFSPVIFHWKTKSLGFLTWNILVSFPFHCSLPANGKILKWDMRGVNQWYTSAKKE